MVDATLREWKPQEYAGHRLLLDANHGFGKEVTFEQQFSCNKGGF
jgi:hypothetical protein